MRPHLYVWKSPRADDPATAAALVDAWNAAGGGADDGPFEPDENVRWFHRELRGDAPPIWNPDAPPKAGPHPDRIVVVPLEPPNARATAEEVYSLAMKYDLIVYDPERGAVHAPMAEIAAYASATFWPRGAIRAAVAGAVGAGIAAAAWLLNIPILSGIAIIVGAFLVVMAVYTLVHEGRVRIGRR